MTAVYIYKSDLPAFRPADRPFYSTAKYCTHHGVVLRLEGDGNHNWVTGLMTKNSTGTKWVWKKHTLEELKVKGIALSDTQRHLDTAVSFR